MQALAAYARARSLTETQERDLPASIELASRAVALLPENHWLTPVAQLQAARSLGLAATEAGRMPCEPAIQLLEQATRALPTGHPWECQILTLLQLNLFSRLATGHPSPAAEVLRLVEVGRRALAVLVVLLAEIGFSMAIRAPLERVIDGVATPGKDLTLLVHLLERMER